MPAEAEQEQQRIAARFVAARRAAEAPISYPGTLPRTLADAYAVQDLAIALDGDRVGGWKVGRIGDADLPHHDVNRLAGPIFTRLIRSETLDPLVMPVFDRGFAAAEAEFLLRIGSDVAPSTGWSIDRAAALVEAVHVGIEIASSPFPGINSYGPAVTASDFGNNYGLVVGAEVPAWRNSGFERWPVAVEINGVEVGRATTETMLDGAMGAVSFLLDLLGERGIALAAGSWVSTGAVTGVHVVRPGDNVVAKFGGDLAVRCSIEAAQIA